MKNSAFALIILFGLVSLFSDATYEGMRSVIGPYLAFLGASGFVIGVVTGIGEFIGYALRLLSGTLSDRTGRYWLIAWVGYLINLLAVPLLAFANRWEVAAALVIAERLGKALRTPARDALISYAANKTGRGYGFGIHEAMDRVGGLLGPLLIFFVGFFGGSLHLSFLLLGIPALVSLACLALARKRYPNPQEFEPHSHQPVSKKFPPAFWLYMGAISFIALGFINFPLLAYFFLRDLPSQMIPLFYALAVFVSGVASLYLGKLYDRYGMKVIFFTSMLSALFVPFVFSSNSAAILFGMVLWGVGWGSQGSILRAAVSRWVSTERRATAYGILNFSLGVFSFLNGAIIGLLIDRSLIGMILFSLIAQFLALPLLYLVGRYETNR